MYSVMIADDDYPVLELLSKTVNWERHNLRLLGAHEDGLSAWRQAQEEMPHILITDIGMPQMDGLELISRLKEKNANLRVVILSCHDEFHFAQQAMRLNVQDYLLKDSFNPGELEQLLLNMIRSLDEETLFYSRQSRLKQLVDGTEAMRRERWLKGFIHQPLVTPDRSIAELNDFGLLLEGQSCLPVIAYLDGYPRAKKRFISDQTLQFAVSNVMEEVLQDLPVKTFHFGYSVKISFLFFCYAPSLKRNIFDQVKDALRKIQRDLKKILKLRFSFIWEGSCADPEGLKLQLIRLLDSKDQRFYLQEGDMARKREQDAPEDDLFAVFGEAGADLRDVLLGKPGHTVSAFVERWIEPVKARRHAPEHVKDWLLKLLIDQRLKLQSMHAIRPGETTDTLLNELGEAADSFEQLKAWLIEYLQSQIRLTGAGSGPGKREAMHPEVLKACQYVAMHLDKRISLDEIAEHLYLNPSYFSRLFKKETGENFIEYVTRMKMEKAKELLHHAGLSIGSISDTLGYEHPSYFIKIFKTLMGMTPAEYREKSGGRSLP